MTGVQIKMILEMIFRFFKFNWKIFVSNLWLEEESEQNPQNHDNNVLIGVREGGEKLLVKSEDEYTSPIAKIFKVGNEYIILTENSLYIVNANIATKRIS